MLLDPRELIEKLCVLVPAPRTHLLRYQGVLAPHAAWRSLIVPRSPEDARHEARALAASELHEDRLLDHLARVLAVLGVSIPGFWLGLMLIAYGAVQLRLPPAFALGVYYTAINSRMTRSSLIEVLGQDYIRTARAMGLSRGHVLAYALKNALVPVVSVSALSIGYMFGRAIIIEQVFNIAGLSRTLLTAIFQRDYYTVQAVVLVITTVFIAANLAADVLYRVLNPKFRAARA